MTRHQKSKHRLATLFATPLCLAALSVATAYASDWNVTDPNFELYLNSSDSVTLNGHSTVKSVTGSGTLDLAGYTLVMTDASGEEFYGTLKGDGLINMTLTREGGFNFIGNGEDFTGIISVTGPEVFTLQKNLGGEVTVDGAANNQSSKNGFSIGMNDVRIGKRLRLNDGSWYVVVANSSGKAPTLTTKELSIGNDVRVAIGKVDASEYIWTNDLTMGEYTIIQTESPIDGKFVDTVYTGSEGFSDVNQGMPLVDATLDQQEKKIVLKVSPKEEDVVVPGTSTESNSLLNVIKDSRSVKLLPIVTATIEALQTFSREIDTAREAISAASSMAVNTAAPTSMARLDSLNSGGATPGTTAGAFSPLNAFTSSMSLSASGFAELEQYRAMPRTVSPYARMMAQAVGSSGVVNGLWARPVYWHTHNKSEGSNPASSIDGLGFVAGYDLSFGPAMLGVSYAYSHASLDMTGVDGNMDEHTAGLYGSLKLPAEVLLKAWAGYSWQSYDIDRLMSGIGSLNGGTYNRDSDGHTWSASLQLSRELLIGEGFGITPFAGVNVTWLHEDGYWEKAQGGASDALALGVKEYSDTRVHSLVGADFVYSASNWDVKARLGWDARLSGDDRAARDYRLTGIDWQRSLGTETDKHSAVLGLSGSWHLPSKPELSFYGGYDATLGSRSQTHAVTVGARYEF